MMFFHRTPKFCTFSDTVLDRLVDRALTGTNGPFCDTSPQELKNAGLWAYISDKSVKSNPCPEKSRPTSSNLGLDLQAYSCSSHQPPTTTTKYKRI